MKLGNIFSHRFFGKDDCYWGKPEKCLWAGKTREKNPLRAHALTVEEERSRGKRILTSRGGGETYQISYTARPKKKNK